MKLLAFLILLINTAPYINCQQCALGSYYSNNNCIACPNGYYCPSGAIKPIECPLGTFSYSTGGISKCTTCSPGYYANKTASTRCIACPDGYFCKDPTIAPTPCPTGTSSPSKKCANGNYADTIASTHQP